MVAPDCVASNTTSSVPTTLALIICGIEHAFVPSVFTISAINSLSACAGFVSVLNHGVSLHCPFYGKGNVDKKAEISHTVCLLF